MSEKVRRVDFYPDEYLMGVSNRMTAAEMGVYWLICSMIYSKGAPIPNNPKLFARMCLTRQSHVETIIGKLVDTGNLTVENDGKLSQRRSVAELERGMERIRRARESGAKGGRPAKKDQQNQGNSKPTGFGVQKLTNNYQPTTTNIGSLALSAIQEITVDRMQKPALFDECVRLTGVKTMLQSKAFPREIYEAAMQNLEATK